MAWDGGRLRTAGDGRLALLKERAALLSSGISAADASSPAASYTAEAEGRNASWRAEALGDAAASPTSDVGDASSSVAATSARPLGGGSQLVGCGQRLPFTLDLPSAASERSAACAVRERSACRLNVGMQVGERIGRINATLERIGRPPEPQDAIGGQHGGWQRAVSEISLEHQEQLLAELRKLREELCDDLRREQRARQESDEELHAELRREHRQRQQSVDSLREVVEEAASRSQAALTQQAAALRVLMLEESRARVKAIEDTCEEVHALRAELDQVPRHVGRELEDTSRSKLHVALTEHVACEQRALKAEVLQLLGDEVRATSSGHERRLAEHERRLAELQTTLNDSVRTLAAQLCELRVCLQEELHGRLEGTARLAEECRSEAAQLRVELRAEMAVELKKHVEGQEDLMKILDGMRGGLVDFTAAASGLEQRLSELQAVVDAGLAALTTQVCEVRATTRSESQGHQECRGESAQLCAEMAREAGKRELGEARFAKLEQRVASFAQSFEKIEGSTRGLEAQISALRLVAEDAQGAKGSVKRLAEEWRAAEAQLRVLVAEEVNALAEGVDRLAKEEQLLATQLQLEAKARVEGVDRLASDGRSCATQLKGLEEADLAHTRGLQGLTEAVSALRGDFGQCANIADTMASDRRKESLSCDARLEEFQLRYVVAEQARKVRDAELDKDIAELQHIALPTLIGELRSIQDHLSEASQEASMVEHAVKLAAERAAERVGERFVERELAPWRAETAQLRCDVERKGAELCSLHAAFQRVEAKMPRMLNSVPAVELITSYPSQPAAILTASTPSRMQSSERTVTSPPTFAQPYAAVTMTAAPCAALRSSRPSSGEPCTRPSSAEPLRRDAEMARSPSLGAAGVGRRRGAGVAAVALPTPRVVGGSCGAPSEPPLLLAEPMAHLPARPGNGAWAASACRSPGPSVGGTLGLVSPRPLSARLGMAGLSNKSSPGSYAESTAAAVPVAGQAFGAGTVSAAAVAGLAYR